MDRQRVRPSFKDLADDYEQLAFPELEEGQQPSVKITRTRPPTIISTSTPRELAEALRSERDRS